MNLFLDKKSGYEESKGEENIPETKLSATKNSAHQRISM